MWARCAGHARTAVVAVGIVLRVSCTISGPCQPRSVRRASGKGAGLARLHYASAFSAPLDAPESSVLGAGRRVRPPRLTALSDACIRI